MSDELKPCPFCGGEAELIEYSSNSFVKCKKCWATSDDSIGVHKWNTRADPAAPSSELNRESAYPKEIGILAYKNGDYDVFPQLANVAPCVKYVRADENEMLEFTEDVDAVLSLYENPAQGDGKERQRIETLRAPISALKAEVSEQCRLHGIGSEREAKQLTKISNLEAENKRLRGVINAGVKTLISTGHIMTAADFAKALAQADGKAGE